jgi:amino acid permease
MLILLLPMAFKNGGWGMSSFLMFASGVVSYVCATKLVQSGLKLGIYSYSVVVERTFGARGRLAIDIMIAAT